MLLKVPVHFPKGPPSLEALRQRVSDRSGLAIELQCDPNNNAALESPELPSCCEFMVGSDDVFLLLPANRWSYLEYVTLASLIDLGGQYSGGKLPKFVNTKWHDRKWWQFMPRG